MRFILTLITALLLISILIIPPLAFAKGGSHSGGHSGRRHSGGGGHSSSSNHSNSGRSHSTSGSSHAHKSASAGVARDKHGKIKRSSEAKEEFMKQTGYPHGRPGYVVDHIRPLKRGGKDDPSNMQWQTKAAAKAKDKIE